MKNFINYMSGTLTVTNSRPENATEITQDQLSEIFRSEMDLNIDGVENFTAMITDGSEADELIQIGSDEGVFEA